MSLPHTLSRALLSRSAIRAIEAELAAALPPHTLMILAAKAAAEWVMQSLAPPARILVLCGPGNNGGDGALSAAALASAGYSVDIWRFGNFRTEALPIDAAFAWQKVPRSIAFLKQAPPENARYDMVIDALLGIGQSRPIEGPMAAAMQWANQHNSLALKLALDLPTGIDSETCLLIGEIAFKATHTLTFVADKAGLYMNQGADFSGEVLLSELGCLPSHWPSSFARSVQGPENFMASARNLKRLPSSHKGVHGNAMVFGAASGMAGAGLLAARMALKAGAGRVWLGCIDQALEVDWTQPELMIREAAALTQSLFEAELKAHCVVVGPGLSQSSEAKQLLQALFKSTNRSAKRGNKKTQEISGLVRTAWVLDADALNLLANDVKLRALFASLDGIKVITPHPLEAARLLSVDIAQVQGNRFGAALQLAQSLNAVCVLKGNGTVIASPDGRCDLISISAPALAAAGSGDVLAGLIAAILAQTLAKKSTSEPVLNMFDWVGLAATLHAHAGRLTGQRLSANIGATASELIDVIRIELNRIVASA